ncbi:MAG: twin-arginine translocase subunit TatC [Planctomycetes bacterium]|nr:twin-arginine translocase subunit TatC [Planctomycetota bacterium]
MTLGEHLDELRRRVFRSTLAVVGAMVVAVVFHERIFGWAVHPYLRAIADAGVADAKIQAISPLDTFVQTMKLAFLVGFVAASPYVLAQMWGFIAAGLYPHEKRAVRVFFPISLVLFVAGCATALIMILPIALRFLVGFGAHLGVRSDFAIGPYLSLVLSLLFGMGVAFQLPLVMLFLQAVGIVERETLRRGWRLAVLIAFVVSMILTPDPTPVSQTLMAGPLVGLYFLGVWGGRFVGESRERLTLWKAWPLALAVLTLLALFVFRDDLTRLAGAMF